MSDLELARDLTRIAKELSGGNTEQRELQLFIDNDGDLYRSQYQPIIKNLQRKIDKGQYDREKAVKLWMYLADAGAKKYVKEFGGDVRTMFPKRDRLEVAKELRDYAEEEELTFPKEANLTRIAREETLGDALKKLKKGWENFGDVNYVDYGGVMVNYDGNGGFELIDFTTPDSGFEGYLLQEGYYDIEDLFTASEGSVSEDTLISDLFLSKEGKRITQLGGLRMDDGMNASDLARFILAAVSMVPSYGGHLSEDRVWLWDEYEIAGDYSDDDDGKIQDLESEIEAFLKKRGYDV